MNDEAALLAAIRANPDEDTPRLVYADCIQDAQPERAEFIRVQINWERMTHGCSVVLGKPCVGAVPEWCLACRLKAREKELLSVLTARMFEYDLLARLPGFVSIEIGDYTTVSRWDNKPAHDARPYFVTHSRGFIDCVTCTPADWLTHGDVICSAHPVTRVVISEASERDLIAIQDRLIEAKDADAALDLIEKLLAERLTTRQHAKRLAELVWSGITFELPPA